MESYWQDVTPAMAADYLTRNAAGRFLREPLAAMYGRDMATGRWRATHQGIAFDSEGNLLDGQHRLRGVVLAGVTVKFWVTADVDPSAFGAIDIGKGRSSADWFHIAGEKHSSQLAAICRRTYFWDAGSPWSRQLAPSHAEIAKTYEDHPELAEAARFAHAWVGRRTLAPALAGFCWWLFSACDDDDTVYFMDALRSGESLEEGSPILVLRERLLSDRTGRGGTTRVPWATGYQRQEVVLCLTIMAWIHYRKRHKIAKLQLPSVMNDETFPRPI